MKKKFQSFSPKVPSKIIHQYEQKVIELKEQATQVYNSWNEFEINFQKLKSQGFRDKFEKKSMSYQRKMLSVEYISILNIFSLLLITMENNILK